MPELEAVQRANVIGTAGRIHLPGVAVTSLAVSVTLDPGRLIAEFTLGD